jgi:hypothetical protein
MVVGVIGVKMVGVKIEFEIKDLKFESSLESEIGLSLESEI